MITVNWGTEPPSLDPGLASDTTSANILLNIMDPLVKLDEDLNPVPSAGRELETSARTARPSRSRCATTASGRTATPSPREDFEYSWKRTISPELAADYAYQFYGIVGAQEYNGCDPRRTTARRSRTRSGVKAVDDKTLEVKLTSPQPWFVQQVAHHSFLAVQQEGRRAVRRQVDRGGEHRHRTAPSSSSAGSTTPASTSSSGTSGATPTASSSTRVNGRMISDGTTAVQAFEAGEVDVNPNLPPEEIAAAEGDRRTTSSTRASAPTTTASTSRTSPT